MRKIEVKILRHIVDEWHTRGPWRHELSPRDVIERTENGIFHYRLHKSAIVTIVPMDCAYKHTNHRWADRMFLSCGRWRTSTTMARFDAFLSFFCGTTIYEKPAIRNKHTLKKEQEASWYIDGPGQKEPICYYDNIEFTITRDFC